jgi:hypothetical protein
MKKIIGEAMIKSRSGEAEDSASKSKGKKSAAAFDDDFGDS